VNWSKIRADFEATERESRHMIEEFLRQDAPTAKVRANWPFPDPPVNRDEPKREVTLER
jgi:hypothetical protein